MMVIVLRMVGEVEGGACIILVIRFDGEVDVGYADDR